jgi:hypothetical protein
MIQQHVNQFKVAIFWWQLKQRSQAAICWRLMFWHHGSARNTPNQHDYFLVATKKGGLPIIILHALYWHLDPIANEST